MTDDQIERVIPGFFDSIEVESIQTGLIFDIDTIEAIALKLLNTFHWEVAIANEGLNFLTSDNPVAMLVPHLGDPNNEILLPIATNLLVRLQSAQNQVESRTGLALKENELGLNFNQFHASRRFVYSSKQETLVEVASLQY